MPLMFRMRMSNSEKDSLDSLSYQLRDKVITGFNCKQQDSAYINVQFMLQGKDCQDMKAVFDVLEFEELKVERDGLITKLDNMSQTIDTRNIEIKKLKERLKSFVKTGEDNEVHDLKEDLRKSRQSVSQYKFQNKQLREKNKGLKKGIDTNKTIWEGGNAIPVHKLTIGG